VLAKKQKQKNKNKKTKTKKKKKKKKNMNRYYWMGMRKASHSKKKNKKQKKCGVHYSLETFRDTFAMKRFCLTNNNNCQHGRQPYHSQIFRWSDLFREL
jgi:hypothetical protein